MIHPYNITISPSAIIGRNVNIYKGATIGLSGGKHPGAPQIGNSVQIGINSTIIGGVKIGNDVLIAPNTLVNQDIPDHSIVIGNPCKIIPYASGWSNPALRIRRFKLLLFRLLYSISTVSAQ